MTPPSYLLPKGYLSWSQIQLFEKSPREYLKRYFYGEPLWVSPHMKLGIKIHHALDTGEVIDEETAFAMENVPRYPRREEEWNTEISGVPVKCVVDGINGDVLGEYKTGVLWSQDRADEHGQITLEWLMHKITTRRDLEKAYLYWLETETVEKVPRLTGRIETFMVRKKPEDLEAMRERVVKTAEGISRLIKNEIKKI